MAKTIFIIISLFLSISGFSQRYISENNTVYCDMNIKMSDDSLFVIGQIINKSNSSIYFPKEKISGGIEMADSTILYIHIGWNQVHTYESDFSLKKVNSRDTISYTYVLPNKKMRYIHYTQIDINYLKEKDLKKCSKKYSPNILFTDYMAKMEWLEFTIIK